MAQRLSILMFACLLFVAADGQPAFGQGASLVICDEVRDDSAIQEENGDYNVGLQMVFAPLTNPDFSEQNAPQCYTRSNIIEPVSDCVKAADGSDFPGEYVGVYLNTNSQQNFYGIRMCLGKKWNIVSDNSSNDDNVDLQMSKSGHRADITFHDHWQLSYQIDVVFAEVADPDNKYRLVLINGTGQDSLVSELYSE